MSVLIDDARRNEERASFITVEKHQGKEEKGSRAHHDSLQYSKLKLV